MKGVSGRSRPVIAIDGPAGAGKSTLAAHLARRFGFLNLETGAMYRALALKALETATSVEDEAALMGLAGDTRIVLEPRENDTNRVLLDGLDVTEAVRSKEVTEAASRVSVHPRVRAWMVERQRALGAEGGVVMEGRDIGTAVFPDAEVKIFLDAGEDVRSERRFLQRNAASFNGADTGLNADESATREAVLAAVRERDARDRSRAASPLQPAADAVHLDTSGLTLAEVLRRAEELIRTRIPANLYDKFE